MLTLLGELKQHDEVVRVRRDVTWVNTPPSHQFCGLKLVDVRLGPFELAVDMFRGINHGMSQIGS